MWTWEEDKKCLKTTHVDKNGVETTIERTMDEEKEDIQVGFRPSRVFWYILVTNILRIYS